MTPALRVRVLLRRFARRWPRLNAVARALCYFVTTFAAALGFIAAAQWTGQDPYAFAVGVSGLFALACAVLAIQNMRYRWLRRAARKIKAANEALIDRNWELQEAEERAQHLFEAQGDYVVRRDGEGKILFVNDAFCQLAGAARDQLLGSDFRLTAAEQGPAAVQADGTRTHDQTDRKPARCALDRLARKPDPPRCGCAGRAAMRRP